MEFKTYKNILVTKTFKFHKLLILFKLVTLILLLYNRVSQNINFLSSLFLKFINK